MGTTAERALGLSSSHDLVTMTSTLSETTTDPLLPIHSRESTLSGTHLTTFVTTVLGTVHVTTAMETVRVTTTTTTSSVPGEEPPTTPLISAAAVAVSLGIIVVSCAAVMFIKFVSRSRRQVSCRAACLDFVTCTCVRELCCGTEADSGAGAEGEGADHHGNQDAWDPPRYDDALGMQRLDSTTIHGTPPPQYKSLKLKSPPIEGLEGSVNLGFEYPDYPYSFSRQVSCDRVSPASVFSVFEFPRTSPAAAAQQQEGDLTLSPASLLRGQALCYVENHQRASDPQNQSTDNPTTNLNQESETHNGLSTLHNHGNASTGDTSESGRVPDNNNFSWSLGGERLRSLGDSGDQDQPRGVQDRLPSYEDILSWIDGTEM